MSKRKKSPEAPRETLAPKLRAKSNKLKQLDLFYREPTEGGTTEERPEDCVPDLPENQQVREFLAAAPTKGLWMPLGKEVKVMQCWRCKQYGHRTNDKECPLASKGNSASEQFRMAHEDPMYHMHRQKNEDQDEERKQKELRIAQMMSILDADTSEEEDKTKKKKKKKSSHKSGESTENNESKNKSEKKHKKKKKKRRLHPSSSDDSKG